MTRCFPLTASWNLWIQQAAVLKDPSCSQSVRGAQDDLHLKSEPHYRNLPVSTRANIPPLCLKRFFTADQKYIGVGALKKNGVFFL